MSSSPPIPFQRNLVAGSGLLLTGSVLSTAFDPDIVTDVAAKKASAYALISTSFTTGTSQPASLADAMFIYNSPGGAINGNGTLGVVSGIFTSSAGESNTGADQAGLGSTPAADQPYNPTYFPGQYTVTAQLRKTDGDDVLLGDVLSTATSPDSGTKVFCYLSYRSDLAADFKWRLWFYYRRASDGFQTPFAPDISLTDVNLYVPIVYNLLDVPVGAGLGGPLVDGDAAAILGPGSVGTAELANSAVTNAKVATGIDAIKIGGGAVDNTEFSYLNGVNAAIQTQIDGKVPTARTITTSTGLSGGGDLSTNRTLTLADTAVTPGAYTSTNLTVDQQGRITAAASGSAGPSLPLSTANGGFGQDVSTGLTNNQVLVTSGNTIAFSASPTVTTLTGSTSVLTPLLDTASAGTLTIGTTNATGITLQQTTTLAAGKSLSMTAGAGGLSLGSGTGVTTMPTGSFNWNGASSTTLSFINNSNSRLTITSSVATLYGTTTTNLGTSLSTTNISGGNAINIQSGNGADMLVYSGQNLNLRSANNGAIIINSGYFNGGSDIVFQIASVNFMSISSSSPTVYISAGKSLAFEAGGGQLSLGSGTGIWTMPTGTGTITSRAVNYTQAVATSGTANGFTYTGGAHTTLTASTEKPDWNWNGSRTVQFATGALTTQRQYIFQPATYGFVGASTLTNAATVAITGAPAAGTNATITNTYALWIQSGRSQFAGTVGMATGQTLIVGSNTLIGSVTDKLNAGMLAIASQATGDILYGDTTTTFGRLGIGSTGQVLSVSSGLPVWSNRTVIPAISTTVGFSAVTNTIKYPIHPTDLTTVGESASWRIYTTGTETYKARLAVDAAVGLGETLTMQVRYCATTNGTWADLGTAITRVNADGTTPVESAVLTPPGSGYLTFSILYTGPFLSAQVYMGLDKLS